MESNYRPVSNYRQSVQDPIIRISGGENYSNLRQTQPAVTFAYQKPVYHNSQPFQPFANEPKVEKSLIATPTTMSNSNVPKV